MTETATAERTETQPIATEAPRANPLVVLREQLQSRMPEYRNALPAHISPERFTRVVMTAVQMNHDLLACNRQSFFNACMKAASDGLLPDGRQGVIVAFHDNNDRSPTKGQKIAQWMPMVAGILVRFRNSGEFKSITANVVREGDEFAHWIDENGPHMRHVPQDDDTGKKIVKAYAVATMISGGTMVKVMGLADIEKRRKASRAPNSLMWTTFVEEGCMKTVLRNLAKLLPSSSDDIDRLSRDDDLDLPIAELPNAARERTALPHPSGVQNALDTFGGRPAAGDGGQPQATTQSDSAAGTDAIADEATGEVAGTEPAAEPTPAEIARQRGAQARGEGVQRRALPPEYRTAGREAEADAWRSGWDGALAPAPQGKGQ